jgi:hypothetical protein
MVETVARDLTPSVLAQPAAASLQFRSSTKRQNPRVDRYLSLSVASTVGYKDEGLQFGHIDMVIPDLRRYTELPSLIHLLKHQKLTLLDPASWDDKNDSYFLSLYREKRKLKSVLALCFTQARETYHHWRVFAPGSAGVCVQFDTSKLMTFCTGAVPGLRAQTVRYMTLPSLRGGSLKIDDLPFLKRIAFEPENEVRLLWESKTTLRKTLPVPFKLDAVKRITLSPWIYPSLGKEVSALLRTIDGCKKLEVVRSTLISNAEWMERGEAAK